MTQETMVRNTSKNDTALADNKMTDVARLSSDKSSIWLPALNLDTAVKKCRRLLIPNLASALLCLPAEKMDSSIPSTAKSLLSR
ncbi:hypothetical protein AVEN_122368-1 [Araneus ventricosus]|uniref:Uncharacterized protein n=1 Tax=Araneus ventricosus TaxID=182803 RepID=A0A4Y2LHL2_ARAVE|nr:hypothetical protein AVEN_122368-1 [Araneus ventricosus]